MWAAGHPGSPRDARLAPPLYGWKRAFHGQILCPLPPQRLPLRNQLHPKNLNVEAWDLHGPRGRHNSGMKYCALLIAVLATLLMGCDNESPTTPSPNAATVRFTYLAPTALNPDLAASTQACVQGVGRTHIHPSWRNFTRIDMQAVGSDRWKSASAM